MVININMNIRMNVIYLINAVYMFNFICRQYYSYHYKDANFIESDIKDPKKQKLLNFFVIISTDIIIVFIQVVSMKINYT